MKSLNLNRQKELEQLTARLWTLLPGSDSVTHDAKIRGKSGIVRQIDILVRKRIGLMDVSLIIDTKLKAKKVRRTDVLNVVDIQRDVGAGAAVIVAPNGFDRGALQLAEENNLLLLKSIDAKSGDWVGKLLVPVIMDVRILAFWTTPDASKKAKAPLAGILRSWWRAHQLPPDLEGNTYTIQLTLKEGDAEIDTAVHIHEKRWHRFRQLPLSFFGLFNEKAGQFATESMETEFNLSEVVEEWGPIPSTLAPSACVPVYFLMVVPAHANTDTIEVPMLDGRCKFEICPPKASMDLLSKTTSVPCRLSFRSNRQ